MTLSDISVRELAYRRQRLRHRLLVQVFAYITVEAERRGFNYQELATAVRCDPQRLTHCLSSPGALTLNMISDLLAVLDAELMLTIDEV